MSKCRVRDNHINDKQTAQDFGWKPKEHETEESKLAYALAQLVYCCENNTGNEPSLSCYQRALDEAKYILKGKSK